MKLVADRLLFTPLSSNLVDKHDVVRLSNGNFLVVWRKADSSHDVTLVVLLSWSCGEFIFSLSILVVEMDDSVSCGHGVSLGVRGPGQSCNLLHAIDWRLQIFPILDLHLSFRIFKFQIII